MVVDIKSPERTARECLGQWLKDHPHANRAHCVLRYEGEMLVSYCGLTFPTVTATEPSMSVLLCSECNDRVRQREAARRRMLAARFNTRKIPPGMKARSNYGSR